MSHIYSPADILRGALVGASKGNMPSASGDWPIFVGHMPEEIDQAIGIFDTTGNKDGRVMKTGETIIHPGYQIRIRTIDYPDAYSKIHEIQKFLDTIANKVVSLGGDSYIINATSLKSGPFSLGQEPDSRRRENFTVNGTMTITLT